MNLPKFVFEDVPLFLGLIRDLFPGLECCRVSYPNFKVAVETALAEEGYVVIPAQVSRKRSYTDRKLRSERLKSTLTVS
jgi:dynein heavy chain